MGTRRQWIQGAGGLLSWAALSRLAAAHTAASTSNVSGNLFPDPAAPSLANFANGATSPATASDAHFFLFAQVYGAWDVCLAFDPKDREGRLPNGERQFDQPYAYGEVKDLGNGLRVAPQAAPLAKYSDRLAIINGIDMQIDMGHITDVVMTGALLPRQSNRPFVQAVLAAHHPYVRQCSIPHLYVSYDNQFFSGPYGANSLNATATDFLAIIGAADKGQSSRFTDLQGMVSEYQRTTTNAAQKRALKNYVGAIGRATDLGTRLTGGGFTPPTDPTNIDDLGKLLGQLYATRVLGAATLSFGEKYGFDTHSDHYKLHPMDKYIADVVGLCDQLAKVPLDDHTSVLDRTTVVMVGEFCRTPLLNSNAGKDHNIRTNSLALLGHRVPSGVYGASGVVADGGSWLSHAGLPIDYRTGHPQATGRVLQARDIWAGFGGVAGLALQQEFGPDAQPIGFLG